MQQINKFTLPNGLRVVHHSDFNTQMVAINLLYNVGAKNEDPNHTGFAHLFEHLMFSGSIHIPNYDTPLQMAGGESNAWTNNDITNYYLTIPKQNVEIGFWLESDRMLGLDISEKKLEAQKGVVSEEFKQRCINMPYGDIGHLIRSLAYDKHPYAWPTIGKDISHIKEAQLEDVNEFFHTFYTPSNAILAVTGNISFEEVRELSYKWFGPIPPHFIEKPALPKEPKQTKQKRLKVRRDVPADSLFMVYHMCDRLHPDYYAYDILSDILCNGLSSRLYQSLVLQQEVFTSIDAYISGSIENGLFYITGKPSEGISLHTAEDCVNKEIDKLIKYGITDKELKKVQNKFESTHVFTNLHYLNLASNIAYFEMLSQAEDLNEEVKNYRSVTPEQLERVAKKLFQEKNSSILHYAKI